MGRINREVIEEIRATANIVDVVGSYVSLRKRGKNYTGLCPFHTEKAPSFTVSDEKQIFHCFGCGASGSVFDFLMRVRNLTFAEAVRELANRLGIALPQERESAQGRRMRELADSLRRANEIAAKYYNQALLAGTSGSEARGYLQGRGIERKVIDDFQLGYAPNSWDGLKSQLLRYKVDLREAVQSGLLVRKPNDDYYDRFRNRLMFPIKDMSDRTVGFGGRALDESMPKYLNSPESPIFNKGRILYGLTAARESSRQHGEVLAVEGYFDLLVLYSHGIRNVVAPLGTALTGNHIRLMRRLAPQAVVVFDGDEAGMRAAMRSLEQFLREKLPVRMLLLPEEMDPDDFLRQKGKEPFFKRLEEARPLMEVFLEECLADYDGSVPGRLNGIKAATPMLKLLDSSITQEGYLRLLSQRLAVSEEVLYEELGWRPGSTRVERGRQSRDSDTKVPTMEEVVLRILVNYPQWVSVLDDGQILDNFDDQSLRKLAQLLLKYSSESGNLDLSGLLLDLENEDSRRTVSSWSVETSPWPEDIARLRLQEYLEGIRVRKGRREDQLKRIQQEIQAAEQSQNEQLLAELLSKKAALLAGNSNDKANLSKGEMV
jgi:DNA primase